MTDRLGRTEALLLDTAERLDRTNTTLGQTSVTLASTSASLSTTNSSLATTNATLDCITVQREQNARSIDALLEAISTTDIEVRRLGEDVAANETRFNILISEMRSDRRASQQSSQALLLPLTGLNGWVDDLEQAS